MIQSCHSSIRSRNLCGLRLILILQAEKRVLKSDENNNRNAAERPATGFLKLSKKKSYTRSDGQRPTVGLCVLFKNRSISQRAILTSRVRQLGKRGVKSLEVKRGDLIFCTACPAAHSDLRVILYKFWLRNTLKMGRSKIFIATMITKHSLSSSKIFKIKIYNTTFGSDPV